MTFNDQSAFAIWYFDDAAGSTTASNALDSNRIYAGGATYNLPRVAGALGSASFGRPGVQGTSIGFASSASLWLVPTDAEFVGSSSIGSVFGNDYTIDFVLMASSTGTAQRLDGIISVENFTGSGASSWRGFNLSITGSGAGPYAYDAVQLNYGNSVDGYNVINWPFTPAGSGSWTVMALTHKLSGSSYIYPETGTQMLYEFVASSTAIYPAPPTGPLGGGSGLYFKDTLGNGPIFVTMSGSSTSILTGMSTATGRFDGTVSMQFDGYTSIAAATPLNLSPTSTYYPYFSSAFSMSSPMFQTVASSSNWTIDFNVFLGKDASTAGYNYPLFLLVDEPEWTGARRGQYCEINIQGQQYGQQHFSWKFIECESPRPTTGSLNSSATVLTSTTIPFNGSWYHLACRRSGSEMKMYVNGSPEVSMTMVGTTDIRSSVYADITSSNRLAQYFGYYWPYDYSMIGAKIDKFRVSSTSRSDTDLSATYTANSSSFQLWTNGTASTVQTGIINRAAYTSITNRMGVFCNQSNLTGGFYGIDRLRISTTQRTATEIIALGSGSTAPSIALSNGLVLFPTKSGSLYLRPLQRAIPDVSKLPYHNITSVSSSAAQMTMSFDQPVTVSGTAFTGTVLSVSGVTYRRVSIALSASAAGGSWNFSKLNPGTN